MLGRRSMFHVSRMTRVLHVRRVVASVVTIPSPVPRAFAGSSTDHDDASRVPPFFWRVYPPGQEPGEPAPWDGSVKRLPGESGRPLLVSIPASHYVEKVRWALELMGVEYDESAHFPGMIYGATAAAAKASHAAGLSKKGRSVPVLRLPRTEADPVGRALVDSADILEYLGTLRGGSWLFPQDTAAEVRELCAYFDAKLGPHTRRYGYHHMLPRMVLSTRLLRHKVAPLEAAVGTLAFPFLRGFVRKGLNISPAKAEESLQRVRAVFDEVGNVLARDSGPVAGGGSSRGFLVGDSFTAADLTFAALSAMLLLPPHYGVPLPEPEEVGQEAAAVIAEMRATPAGMHAMRMYGQCRTPATP